MSGDIPRTAITLCGLDIGLMVRFAHPYKDDEMVSGYVFKIFHHVDDCKVIVSLTQRDYLYPSSYSIYPETPIFLEGTIE